MWLQRQFVCWVLSCTQSWYYGPARFYMLRFGCTPKSRRERWDSYSISQPININIWLLYWVLGPVILPSCHPLVAATGPAPALSTGSVDNVVAQAVLDACSKTNDVGLAEPRPGTVGSYLRAALQVRFRASMVVSFCKSFFAFVSSILGGLQGFRYRIASTAHAGIRGKEQRCSV